MKHIFFALTLCFTAFNGFAEVTLRGNITYQNTGEKMKTLQITARGASPTITRTNTNTEGMFVLTFPNGKIGDLVTLELGTFIYDLVNDPRDLNVTLTDNPNYKIHLVVCKKGERDANAAKYYGISEKYILGKHTEQVKKKDAEIALLQKKLEQKGVNEIELTKQLYAAKAERAKLDEEFEAQKKKAFKMAEDFSRVDLAQADAIYRKAFETFKQGDIEGARQVLNSNEAKQQEVEREKLKLEVTERKQRLIEVKLEVQKEEKALVKAEVALNSATKEVIKKKLLDAQLAELQFKFDEAEILYTDAVALDKKDIQNLITLAYFLKSIKKLDKSKDIFYNEVLPLRGDYFFKSSVLSEISNIYFEMNLYKESEDYLRNSIFLLEKSLIHLPKNFEMFYAKSLTNLGRLLYKFEKIDSSGILFLKASDIYNHFSSDTLNIVLKSYEANNYKFLATYFDDKNQIEKADSFYNLSISSYRELKEKNVNENSALYAEVLLNYAQFFLDLHRDYQDNYAGYQKADSLISESAKIYKSLAETNPFRYNVNIAALLRVKARFFWEWKRFFSTDNINHGENDLKEAVQIMEQLYQKDTLIYRPELARTYGDVSNYYSMFKNYTNAINYCLLALKHFEGLCDTNSLVFFEETAKGYYNLGVHYFNKKEFKNSIYYLHKSLFFYTKLDNKNSSIYQNSIASINRALGLNYTKINEDITALDYFKKSEAIYRKVVIANGKLHINEWGALIDELISCLDRIIKENNDTNNISIYDNQISEYKMLKDKFFQNKN